MQNRYFILLFPNLLGFVDYEYHLSTDAYRYYIIDIDSVSNKFNKSMQVNYEIDSNLIGGIIIKHKDNEIDLSLDNKLSGLKELLIN